MSEPRHDASKRGMLQFSGVTLPRQQPRIQIQSLLVAIALATFPACGGGSSDPPTAPPTATSITINLRDIVLAGLSVVATGTATMSNGQTQAVTAGWRSDVSAVATITDAGNLTGISNGEVTISVSFSGANASKRIRIAPNYDGRWQGVQVISACNATGDFAGFCDEGGSIVGLPFPVAVTMRHPADLAVSGEFTIEDLPFPTFNTQIESDGRIRFSSVQVIDGIRAAASWDMNVAEGGRLGGTIHESYSAPGLASGEITYDSTLGGLMRSATASDGRSSATRLVRVRARATAKRR